jgi:cell division protein FtsB
MISIKNLLRSKMVLLALLGIFVFIGQLHVAQWQRKREIAKEIEKLTSQERDLAQKNQELSDSLRYLQTTNFQERIAREQLELKKEGETVVRFQDAPKVLGQTTNQAETGNRNNIEKWLAYFFKH